MSLISEEYRKTREMVMQKILQLRTQGEYSHEKMATEISASLSFVEYILGNIEAIKQRITQEKATGSYNRALLARDAAVSIGVIKLLEACIGQAAAAHLCGEAGELSVCLNI